MILLRAAHPRVPLGRRAARVPHLVDDRAEDQAEPEQADRPPEQGAALQPPDEPERADERRCGLGASASLRRRCCCRRRAGLRARLAAPTRTTKASANRPSGHQWSPPNGRICWPQPIGDNHAGQALATRRPLASTLPSMFPTPLSTNASPRTAAARPLAPRVVDESCTVTAATPANTMPRRPTAIPAVNDPAAGCPVTIPARPSSAGQHDVGADGDDRGRRPGRHGVRRRRRRPARRARSPRSAGCAGRP